MGVVLHWFLPTNGDSRTDLSLGNAAGATGRRVTDGGIERAPDLGYIGQSHDPVDWKHHHIGNYLLSDVPPPNHGQF